MDPIKKKDLVETNAKKYKLIDPMREKIILEKMPKIINQWNQIKKKYIL